MPVNDPPPPWVRDYLTPDQWQQKIKRLVAGTDGIEQPDEANPKDLIGVKKPRLDLVPAALDIHASMAMANGAEKYGPFNWREKPVRASIYIAAARRHLAAWFDGEDTASDSGVHHLGHAAACLAILLDAQATGNLVDDRPPHGAAGPLIEELTK